MKLIANISDREYKLDIRREGSRGVARIDGREVEVEALALQPSVYLLRSRGRVYECRVDQSGDRRESLEVTVGSRAYVVTLADPKRLRGAAQLGAHADGTAQIVAPMPGKVVRVLVEDGALVEAGAGLIVVEAMKMQNEMKSPKAGKVTSIKVVAGATVNAGDVLAVIE